MGNWRAARLMAAEDVPADQLGDRMSEWAQNAAPENYHARVAKLLNVPVVGDSGQPAMLALSNHTSIQQLASASVAQSKAAPSGELPATFAPAAAPAAVASASYALPPLDTAARPASVAANNAAPMAQSKPFEQAFTAGNGATPAASAVGSNKVAFVSKPVVQATPRSTRAAPAGAAGIVDAGVTQATGMAAAGDHLVQLGSFSTQASAERAWNIYVKRYPDLAKYQMVITQAKVRGKNYFRVSAGGFQRASAASMCSAVKASNQGCITWAANSPLPGAVDRNVRMASR